jgi:flagellar hook-basal body complex protein FliE
MKPISTDQILSQIRALNAELAAAATPAAASPAAAQGPSFGDLLKSSVDSVNEAQKTAEKMATDFEAGKSDASLVEVMIATQEADLSFRAMTEVRNKLVTAYQEIMNMPV